jgi:hypothetical protein
MTILRRRTVPVMGRHRRQINGSRTMRVGRRRTRKTVRTMGLHRRIKGGRTIILHHHRRHRIETEIGIAIMTAVANRITTCTRLLELLLRYRRVNRFW